jgi:hypothetical protein
MFAPRVANFGEKTREYGEAKIARYLEVCPNLLNHHHLIFILTAVMILNFKFYWPSQRKVAIFMMSVSS